jgi:uncharacterized protein YraI
VTIKVSVVANGCRVTVLDGVGETDWVEVSVVVARLTVVVAAGKAEADESRVKVSQSTVVVVGVAGKTTNLSLATAIGPTAAPITENARVYVPDIDCQGSEHSISL